jgi:hypothetical protein
MFIIKVYIWEILLEKITGFWTFLIKGKILILLYLYIHNRK